MFHVYYVNDGCMLVPQTSGIGGRVLDLQQSIRDVAHVEVLDQVLYLQSGEQVRGDAPLSTYAQYGTETAPFFLLRRYTRFDPPTYVAPMPDCDDLQQRHTTWQQLMVTLERSSTATVNEFHRYWQYTQQFDERLYRTCVKYASDHTFIYQGWQAMLKNLIESAGRIHRLIERCAKRAECLESMRERGIADLADFDGVLAMLAKITVPNQLLAPAFRSPTTAGGNSASATTSSSSSGTSGGGDEVSLYDWIASTDTTYSPSQMASYLIDDLKNTDDADLRASQEHIQYVNNLLADDKYRNIGGVDRRIATIREKLRSIETNHFEVVKITDVMLKEIATTAVNYHRRRLTDLSKLLNDSYAQATNIVRSKEELMRNINTRVSNWIQRCYERLGLARKFLTVFEGKYNGLRDRLRLVRQIREAPILYVTAVAEVIRRDALQKEFNAWFTTFAGRCKQFIDSENKLRADFYAKLGEHFLRNIFFDLSDRMPDFKPQCAPFDRNLPRVTIAYLRDLRKTFPDMHELLNVTQPRVYERLHVVDPTIIAVPVATLPQTPSAPALGAAAASGTTPSTTNSAAQTAGSGPLRREESFFVREPTANIDTINENFPSQNWLSEEHIDMSPGSQLFIATRGAGAFTNSTSNASLHVDTTSLASPTDLGPLSDFALSVYGLRPSASGSKPITIDGVDTTPGIIGSDDNGNGETTIVMDVSTSTVRQPLSSTGSSPQCGPVATRPRTLSAALGQATSVMSNSLEICSPSEINELIRAKCGDVSTTVQAIYAFFAELRKSVIALQSEMDERRAADTIAVHARLVKLKDERLRADEERKMQLKLEADAAVIEAERRHKELSDIVEHERYLRKEKERELDEQRRVAEKLNEDLLALMKAKDDLGTELVRADLDRLRLREQLDTDTSMDYLQIELKAVEQLLKRELTNDEVNEIKREIEKRKISKSEVSSLSSEGATASAPSPQPANCEPTTSKIRSDYEKAFRSKMELIVRGIEEKKNKEMAAQRDEIEAEMRKETDTYTRRLKERIAELEERVEFFERVDSDHRKRDTTATRPTADVQLQVMLDGEVAKLTANNEILTMERMDSLDMSESVATVVPMVVATDAERDDTESTRSPSSQSVVGAPYDRATQTRIRGHDMELMISLRNIHEGCSVLIMWNMAHNAYMIFSTSPQLYVVREPQHITRNIDPATRRNWMFVTVVKMEVCQIRKVENRYNLPVNTRFHWVTVVPLDVEHPVSTAARSPPTGESAEPENK